jgi:uncharacterized protein
LIAATDMQPHPGDTLVVAGLWVRPLAESARRAGWRVIGLDLFGDRDTRQAAQAWHRIGDPARFELDGDALATQLQRAERGPGVIGWVPGSGFEGRPDLLEAGGAALPRLGMAADDVAALRDPARFFATLDRLGLAHPEVVLKGPAPEQGGWLVKHAGGSGGWHIRAVGATPGGLGPGEYLQRRVAGDAMSVLFLADGERALRVGLSRQDIRPRGDAPFVYHGAIGPVHDPRLAAEVDHALSLLVPAFGLRGLASADFVATLQGACWLEINPRPSATMLLYDDLLPRGLVHAHVQACAGQLPERAQQAIDLRGHCIVHAELPIEVDVALSDTLAARPHTHDLPQPGARIGAGEPLCSVSARAASEAAVRALLDQACREVLALATRPVHDAIPSTHAVPCSP